MSDNKEQDLPPLVSGDQDITANKNVDEITDTDKSTGDDNEAETTNSNIRKDWPLRDIKEPHANDVLYGRGGGTNHHPGNKRFRAMVEKRKNDYVNSKRLDKPLVALEIIRDWRAQDPPGRFLKQDESTGLWHDVGDRKSREKTSQALREKGPSTKNKEQNKVDHDDSMRKGKVSFMDHDQSSGGKKKISRATLFRDHSLGGDYIKPGEKLSLTGFSFDEPIMPSHTRSNSYPTPYLSDMDFSSQPYHKKEDAPRLARDHSLAMNPLRNAEVDKPARPGYFDLDQGKRRGSRENWGRPRSNSPPSFSRSSFSRRNYPEEYRRPHEGYYSSYHPWEGHGDPRSGNGPYPSYEERRPVSDRGYPPETQYPNEAEPYRNTPYSESYGRRPNSPGYHERSNYEHTRHMPYDNYDSKMREVPHSSSSRNPYTDRQSHYMANDSAYQSHGSYGMPPFNESQGRMNMNHGSPSESQRPTSIQNKRGMSEFYDNVELPLPQPEEPPYDPISGVSPRSNSHASKSYHHGRPSTVKRATSNQNEEADTKKESKMRKKPGLNREHSITARRLHEEQKQREELQNHHQQQQPIGYPQDIGPSTSFDGVNNDIRNLSLSATQSFSNSPSNHHASRPPALSSGDKVSTIDAISKAFKLDGDDDLNAGRPATLTSKSRMSTIDAIEDALAKDGSDFLDMAADINAGIPPLPE
eukprot:CAMPEP_0178943728 /NCGR_PEP_ID=MMETSP0789-20121207/2749_1 /TAXON_ID=3005 /ORGANISM="Rhizosolenia setigera, Strain CCMP 1694" /LENGTH=696 /DNA_ID=CAMNT_0020623357 /DNA_START=132 /DNA_END=2222 /DNA_ORIENTATION=+